MGVCVAERVGQIGQTALLGRVLGRGHDLHHGQDQDPHGPSRFRSLSLNQDPDRCLANPERGQNFHVTDPLVGLHHRLVLGHCLGGFLHLVHDQQVAPARLPRH